MKRSQRVSLLGALALLGCDATPTPTDRPATDGPVDLAPREDAPADAVVDATADAVVEATADAVVDAPADGSCILDAGSPDGGVATGFLRFANLTRGAGTLRFTARNLPMFREAFIEAVVPEGAASAQVPTLAVAYEIRVTPAPGEDAGIAVDVSTSDAGILTDGAASPATACTAMPATGEVVPPACTDVYVASSCTVVLAGSPTGSTALRQERRLWRFADLPTRGDDCATGRVRVVNWFANGPLLHADAEGGPPIARNAAYSEGTGARNVPAGPLRVALRSAESADVYGVLPAGAVLGAHTMTLHLWGDARDMNARQPAAILLDDLPPSR
jgi:hypothetical protein